MSSNIRVKKICKFCTGEFIARTTVTDYCSTSCARKAYKKRKRDENIKVTNDIFLLDKAEKFRKLSNEYLSINDTCSLLGISRWTLARLIKERAIISSRIGRRVIISKESINKLFK